MYEKFLSPGKIGNLTLKNRSVFPPMGSGYVEEEHPMERLIDYHVRRVMGGCAMNIVEIAAVHFTSKSPTILGIYDDRFIPCLAKLAAAIKSAGGIACIQLWHGGRQTSGKPFGGQPVAPSAVTCAFIGEEPKAMTADEVPEIIKSYGDAARRAVQAGFDAVEIHGAHGYLIDQFLNPYTNKRTDRYGGDLNGRARFGCEVIENVRSNVGSDFPVIFRMSAIEHVEGGIELKDAIEAAKLYAKAGLDALDVSQGCYDALAYTVPPYYYPPKLNAYNASQIKKHTNLPMIVAGRITHPELAEEILQKDMADFIGLGRPMLADPDFVKKTMEGQADDIVRCIACNQGCVGRMFKGLGNSCIFNPATGNEREVVIKPAREKKKVLVIGGGPAGLEAARVAQTRGHEVILLERDVNLGGQFIDAGKAPHKGIFAESAVHMGYRAQRAGVDIRVYTPATEERIKAIDPDVVIVATGADPIKPKIPGIDRPNVYDSRTIILSKEFIKAEHVAVIGGGLIGLEAMEILSFQGKKVEVIEMKDEIGEELEVYIRPYVLSIIKENAVKVHTGTKCVEIGDGFITVEKDDSRRNLPFDAVVIAVGTSSNTGIVDIIKKLGYEHYVVGDAKEPSQVLNAIWGGNAVARSI
ncbi:MAG: FAD-dependent oxidoreductase [Christensenellales bacterium]|jgi:2,4-dienoyl-CoA reductase-like NADH-dependent reductase (Old Yellow Enzyme family)/thioredoxin reductase